VGLNIKGVPVRVSWGKFEVVVVLPDPFRGMGVWRNSTETQQLGYAPRS